MLRPLRPIETTQSSKEEQKLLNLIIANYVNSGPNPFEIPTDLKRHVNKVNAKYFHGTNWILYRPEQTFSPTDLLKLTELKEHLKQIDSELDAEKKELQLESDTEISILHQKYMHRLHKYNELKDQAQALLGKLAQLTGSTTRDLYPQFDLDFDD